MPVLLDGNNLLHRLPQDRRSRKDVRRAALDLVRREGVRVTVVFDGPPPAGTPEREALGSVTVVYAGSSSADEVILRRVSGARRGQLTVVTDDRELARRARQAGARVQPVASWLDKLTVPDREKPAALSPTDLADWEDYFRHEPPDEE